ncbi:glycosyltransferase family 2 protein [Chloroflexi bacterium TSY]|nr:glycosyltransferase family 2 protein [Chloroflexi bacterium TSY]
MKIFIVIAAYNESKSIHRVLNQLLKQYTNIVVVDDGSADDTATIVAKLPVYLLRHSINRGQGASLQTGICFALENEADIIVTFDADGQHDVQDISELIAPIMNDECDIALGSRFLGEAHNIPLLRKLMLKAGIVFTRLVSNIQITDVHNGLRALSRQAASNIHITMDRMAHASEILDQIHLAQLRYKEVPVNIYYSEYSLEKGQSSWNALRIATQILINRTVK